MHDHADNLTAARSNDRRRALEVLRDTLAEKLDTTESQVHAQLAAQYRATLAEIAELDAAEPAQKVTVLDELASRRQDRSTVAVDPVRPARRGKSGDR